MKKITALLIFCISLSQFSCQNKHERDAKSIVKEWYEKEILFPDTLTFSRYGEEAVPFQYGDAGYKVLLYVDSLGCTSCRLKLSGWKAFIREVDSLSQGSVRFLFILTPKNVKELTFFLRREEFDYPVCVDTGSRMNRLNHFPANQSFQCFLLDRDNRVAYIGNPVDNRLIKEEYLSIITGKSSTAPQQASLTTTEVTSQVLQLGRLKPGSDTTLHVNVKNTGNTPLRIYDVQVSCGCISISYDRKPVKPGSSALIGITYHADALGTFSRTISVNCNITASPITITITGEVR